MMLTALFFVWLQMSAQSQNCNVIMNGSMICQDHQGYIMEYGGEFVAADETEGKPPKYQKPVDLYPIMCGGAPPHPCNEPPGGPVDVPAVQVEAGEGHSYCEYRTGHGVAIPFNQGNPSTCEKGGTLIVWGDKITTCADKSRILEHDENSPPKYWCRKVQP